MKTSLSVYTIIFIMSIAYQLSKAEDNCLCGKDSIKVLSFAPEAEITEAVELDKKNYQPILDNIIEKHRDLKFFNADIVQIKKGGVFKRPIRKTGKITARLPDKFKLDMSESGLLILVDGRYAWIYDTDLDDVEIWDIKSKKNKNTEPMDVSSFFLGSSIKTAEELEKEFHIKAFSLPDKNATHFLLKPYKSEKQKFSELELTIPDDAVIPSFVCTTGIKNDKNRQPLKTVQFISNLKTNFDTTENPADSIFIFKPNKDMTFRIMDFSGNSKDVDIKYVNKLLNGEK